MFRQIFGSKLQHADPEVRCEGVAELDDDDPQLADVALQDTAPLVRQSAVRRVTAADALVAVARHDEDAPTRAAALERLAEVLCAGAERTTEELASLELDALEAPALMQALVQGAASPAVRAFALARIDDPSLLVQVAANDTAGQLRQAALERVTDETALDEIARAARNRDKGVARSARERVASLRAAREQQAEAERLCTEAERLAASSLTPQEEVAFQTLESAFAAWRASAAQADGCLLSRYERARTRIQERLVARGEQRRARQELLARLDGCAAQLEAIDPGDAPEAVPAPGFFSTAWAACAEGAGDDERRRFEAAHAAYEARHRALEQDASRAHALRALIDERRGAPVPADTTEGAGTAGHAHAEAFDKRWAALEKPENRELRERLEGDWRALRHGAMTQDPRDSEGPAAASVAAAGKPAPAPTRERLSPEALTAELAAVTALLDEADTHIAAGELQKATTAVDAARARSERLGKARGNAQAQQVRERLSAIGPRLGELRAWRRWSTEQARTRLCDEVEQLIGSDEDPATLAQRIRRYRETWKKMDRAEGGAGKALWERFNTACTKAYEPCRQHFAAESEQRNQNLERKTALLEALESRVATTDWDGEVDWAGLDRAYANFRRDWRTIGPVNRRDNKGLMERQDALRKTLEAHLGPVREAELSRRREIVKRLAAMAEGDDLRGAADAAKRAQAEWTPRVRAPRKTEQALWKDFRAACDRIFERLREQRDQQHSVREGALRECEKQCEVIEAAASELAELGFSEDARTREGELMAAVDAARQAFSTAGEVPRARESALRSRYRRACDAVDGARKARRKARQRQDLEGLATRASIAEQLERAVIDGAGNTVALADEMAAQWEALPAVRDKALADVTARYERALAAARGAEPAFAELHASAADSALKERQQICLALEIAAGVESPAEFQQARMALQIDRLQASMTGAGAGGADNEVDDLLRRWYALGPLPAAHRAGLEDRFERARSAAVRSSPR